MLIEGWRSARPVSNRPTTTSPLRGLGEDLSVFAVWDRRGDDPVLIDGEHSGVLEHAQVGRAEIGEVGCR